MPFVWVRVSIVCTLKRKLLNLLHSWYKAFVTLYLYTYGHLRLLTLVVSWHVFATMGYPVLALAPALAARNRLPLVDHRQHAGMVRCRGTLASGSYRYDDARRDALPAPVRCWRHRAWSRLVTSPGPSDRVPGPCFALVGRSTLCRPVVTLAASPLKRPLPGPRLSVRAHVTWDLPALSGVVCEFAALSRKACWPGYRAGLARVSDRRVVVGVGCSVRRVAPVRDDCLCYRRATS